VASFQGWEKKGGFSCGVNPPQGRKKRKSNEILVGGVANSSLLPGDSPESFGTMVPGKGEDLLRTVQSHTGRGSSRPFQRVKVAVEGHDARCRGSPLYTLSLLASKVEGEER